MTQGTKERIAFDVETSRVLQILSSEIYDSPKAFLRENVQNAYDAVLMRCTAQNLRLADRKIQITVHEKQLVVQDDGIGMTEEVLKNNFWKAGSSGKKSELAQRSGVIGTFGIGAMANFGVCTDLRIETRHIDSSVTLISSARREDLRIAQDCIDLERVTDDREPGTIVIAHLEKSFTINENSVCDYLRPYVRFLPVPVLVNGKLISQQAFENTLADKATGFVRVSLQNASQGQLSGTVETLLNSQGRALARLTDISLNGNPLAGEALFVQDGGQTLGFRNLFGLAPIPVSSQYSFGGVINLNILHPTAGREALSRESIQHVANLMSLIEAVVSRAISETPAADQNQSFQQYILSKGWITLAKNVTVPVLPSRHDVPLGQLANFEPSKNKLFYIGRDQTILQRFASEQTNLINVSQVNPRRALQHLFLINILKIQEVPENVIVDRIPGTQLTFEEAMFLVRLRGVLLDDYLMPDVDAAFATISHGVSFHVEHKKNTLEISIARDMPATRMVIECYKTARDVFDGFVKDFVREHLYPQIRDQVPSSTRQGRDALYKRLKENKELFRYEESEFGEVESLLADYLAGKTDLNQVLRSSAGRASIQRQEVRREQVGTVEQEMPDIIESAGAPPSHNEFEPAPPILRPNMITDKKVLTVSVAQEKLNKFQMFLALSERASRTEGEFLRWPHTTKLIWGAHRIIYIFTDATGSLSLYYDIELKEPLETKTTGGAMFPTTTIITKDHIYVPVPSELESAFKITAGAKEFYVRFDTIP
jgi:molecular chaperone HtpG